MLFASVIDASDIPPALLLLLLLLLLLMASTSASPAKHAAPRSACALMGCLFSRACGPCVFMIALIAASASRKCLCAACGDDDDEVADDEDAGNGRKRAVHVSNDNTNVNGW